MKSNSDHRPTHRKIMPNKPTQETRSNALSQSRLVAPKNNGGNFMNYAFTSSNTNKNSSGIH